MRPLTAAEKYGNDVSVPEKGVKGTKNMDLRRSKAAQRALRKGINPEKILKKGRNHNYIMKYNHDLIDQILFLSSKGLTAYDIELLMYITKDVVMRVISGLIVKEVKTEEEQLRMVKSVKYRNNHGQDKVIEAARLRKERDLEIYRNLRKLGYAS